jgi:hypothetical protein
MILLQEEIIGGNFMLKVIGIAFLLGVLAFIFLLRKAYKQSDTNHARMVDPKKSVGTVLVTARHLPSGEILRTKITFEDRVDILYYCWEFRDLSGSRIAAKCQPVSKRAIAINEFEFVIAHVKSSIDNYKISRKKIFQVLEIQKD